MQRKTNWCDVHEGYTSQPVEKINGLYICHACLLKMKNYYRCEKCKRPQRVLIDRKCLKCYAELHRHV